MRPHANLVLILSLIVSACGGYQEFGDAANRPVDVSIVSERTRTQESTRLALASGSADAEAFSSSEKAILFGDLHVHTTFSMDAFALALPAMQGDGVHPPSDACDFARYCSDLDFFSINDHAESLTKPLWDETVRSIRQCNAVAQDAASPDLVAFLGWEWSQIGLTPATHYGHRNVVLRDLDDARIPTRPINARNVVTAATMATKTPLREQLRLLTGDLETIPYLIDLAWLQKQVSEAPICAEGVPVRDLPPDCMETATTPKELFEKLDDWGFESIVIPHGLTWGIHTPYGPAWDKQLTSAMHDPDRQILLEIFSGHGNAEEYRDWTGVTYAPDGTSECPPPTPGYTPCCRRAGEIIRSRCADPESADCDARVAEAIRIYLDAGVYGAATVPGATAEDWKDCGQCRDCFAPPFLHVPDNSAQRLLALGTFAPGAEPLRVRFGFIGSSDNHSARPGTGYKEIDRLTMSDARGPRTERIRDRAFPTIAPEARSYSLDEMKKKNPGISTLPSWDLERQASFFMTGGLVAVHAEGRDRDSIWNALRRREVYGTSGDRILLWFDLVNGETPVPMGSETALAAIPRFRVRAAGAFEQKPGCPEDSLRGIGAERLDELCRGECYNPGDARRVITRIEVVRIRPQVTVGEPMRNLIEDPWKTLPCPGEIDGCVATFDDPDFVLAGRETAYYVRAIQEPTPSINAGGMRCTFNEAGECMSVNPCYGDTRTPANDDCLVPVEERAWSSPIWVTPAR
ncbi:MAG: DUF3604 domain-containing protein [Deltaproteobacteria bacterium]|nr:DUF3604 domain-containing protein [Deltaproteobacteria bacterium]